MDDPKRKQTNDSETIRNDSNDRRDHIKEDRHGPSDVTDWARPPRPDKEKEQERE